jgi:hypothetical protein
MQPIALTCHPATPCQAIDRIGVQVCKTPDGTLKLQYLVEGDMARLRIPAESAPRRADKLWQHTCFEAFVAGQAAGYYEFNFAPSTEWAIYQFSAYREGMARVEAAQPPQISVRCETRRLSLDALIDLKTLSTSQDGSGLRLAVSTIIEEASGHLSYWALAHPSAKPDFHHADSFALALTRRALENGRRH